jgi:hypothetical protein
VPSSAGQIAYAVTPLVTIKETRTCGPAPVEHTAFAYWRFISDTIVERRLDRLVVAFNGTSLQSRSISPSRYVRVDAAQLPMQWQVTGPWRVALRPEVAVGFDWSVDACGADRHRIDEHPRVPNHHSSQPGQVQVFVSNTAYRPFDRAEGGFFTDHELAPGIPALTPTQQLLILAAIVRLDGAR